MRQRTICIGIIENEVWISENTATVYLTLTHNGTGSYGEPELRVLLTHGLKLQLCLALH